MKVFNGMRYTIKMLIQVFRDMREFLILLIIWMLIFGIIETFLTMTVTEENKVQGLEPFSPSRAFFVKRINVVYDVGFAAWPDRANYPWNFYFYFILEAVTIPLVMFNLLIAIISQTYKDIESKKEYYDLTELTEILADYGRFESIFNFLSRNPKK